MDTGGTGFLRDTADVILDLFTGDHHQIGQLVNDDGDIRQMLQSGLGGQLVVGLDLADVILGKQLVAALHLGHAGTQGTGGLARLGDNGHQQMRDAVVLCQFNDLRVDEDELDILGAGTEQKADDDGVDADRFTTAGRTGNQQVGHLAQVSDLGRTGNIFAESHRQRTAHIDVILRLKHCTDIDGGTNLIGHLNTDGRLAGDGGFDTHTSGGKIQSNIIGQAGDAADLDAGLGLQLVPGDGRAAADIQHRSLDTETVQRVDQNVSVFLHLAGGTGLIVGAGRVEKVQRGVAVRLGRLRLHCGQVHGVGVSFGGRRR